MPEVSKETPSETGIVRWFNPTKGYGFIQCEDGADAMVHHTSILMEGYRFLREGECVSFVRKETPKGRQAVSVVIQTGA